MAQTLTPNYSLHKYDTGDNPGAAGLNFNWTTIDSIVNSVDLLRQQDDYEQQMDENQVLVDARMRVVTFPTSNTTVINNDSGKLFNNLNATGQIIFTLPVTASPYGKTYRFVVMTAQNVRIVAGNSTDQIRVAGSISTANTGHIDNATVGGAITLTNVQAGVWLAIATQGTWTVT